MCYKDTRIIDFIEFNPKLTLKKGTVARKIPMENLAPFTRDVYSNTYEPYNGGAKFQNKDTIVARITPSLENGKTAFINHLNKDEIAFGSTEFIVLRAISGVSYPQFVYYFSTSTLFRDNAISSMTGTSGRQRVQENTLYDLIYRLPSLDKQKAIANILSSLDDKIELNNKINKNLEKLAQTLYKRWFVDFEFPNEYGEPYKSSGGEMVESEMGLIPKAWTIKEQGEYFPVITGKKNANVATSDGKYKFFTCSQEVYLTDNYSFEGDAILVAGNGDFNVKYYSGKFEAYQRTYVLIPHNKKLSGILYFAIQHNLNDITSGSRGSVISFITKGHIENFKVVFPNTITLEKLGNIFKNILISIANNNEENDRLSKLRDELLHKLMSGEIEVPIEE